MNKPISNYAWFLLFMLSFIWGTSFILIKRSLVGLEPFQMASLRIFLAWIFFIPFTLKSLREVDFKGRFKHFFLAGVVGNLLPSFLFATAQTRINSTVSGMLNSLSPFFAMLTGYLFFKQNSNIYKIIGVIIGLCGSAMLILFKSSAVAFEINYFAFFVVLATICYGLSVNLLKSFFQDLKPLQISALSLLSVGPLALIIFILTGGIENLMNSDEALISAGYTAILALFSTAISTVYFNKLIQITNPLFAASTTYFMPIFALFWGTLDGETIGFMQLGGMMIILTGVFLIRKN